MLHWSAGCSDRSVCVTSSVFTHLFLDLASPPTHSCHSSLTPPSPLPPPLPPPPSHSSPLPEGFRREGTMSLLMKIALFIWTVHAPAFFVLMILRLELADGHVEHIDPGLTVVRTVGIELKHSVNDHQIEPILIVNFL